MKKASKIIGKVLHNSFGLPAFIQGRQLLNANGDIDISSAGYKYVIDTLSYIRSSVIKQVFYEINMADYVPMDVGEAWTEEIIQNLVFQTGGGFYDGDVDTMSGSGRIASVDAALAPNRMPVKTWAKAANWTIFEIAKAAAANNWDAVSSKLEALKKNWDLGIQETCFLGHPSIATMSGLLNDSEVNINTTLIPADLSAMSTAQLTAFIGGLLPAYYANSNSTRLPDTFIIPTNDYLGLGVPYESTFPNISRLEFLQNALQKLTGNPGFKVLPLTYAQDDINSDRGINKDRYVLYRKDPETLSMSIPIDFTMLEAKSTNDINWQQASYGQYSGVLINRKREVLYLDRT